MTDTTTTHVWYAAYGSNCDDARFNCYLAGGRAAGSTKLSAGCRDTTAPTAVAAITVSAPMYFGGHSPYWGGAVSYMDPVADDAATLAVARRITIGQFSDIVAQECGGTALSADVPIDQVTATGRVDVGGAYGTVVALGDLDGEPVVTCTAAARRRAATPTPDYLETIRTGLARWWPSVVVDGYLDDVYTTAVFASAAAADARRRRRVTAGPPDWSWHDDSDRWDRFDRFDRLDDPWGDHVTVGGELVAP